MYKKLPSAYKISFALAFPYGSNLVDHFDPAIVAIQEAGVLDHLKQLYMPYMGVKVDFDRVARSRVMKGCFWLQ